ncbi:hypothetical protein ACWDA3_61710 [Nonomuraea rubra]
MSTPSALPRGFYCEHTPAKSRVFALVDHPAGPHTMHAVLTCKDAGLAQRVAQLLTAALLHGQGPDLHTEACKIVTALPDAPGASFRDALEHAVQGTWPIAPQPPATGQAVKNDRHDPIDTSGDRNARTPSQARLGDLSGPVVRTIQLLEVHVHDPARLLAAATATGWQPLDDDDLDEDDPRDIVGAVMHFADDDTMPGTDIVTQSMHAALLRLQQGDEVADWSSKPVTANFGTGWRLTAAQDAPAPEPDFAQLFPAQQECSCQEEDCEICQDWELTPRTADVLYLSLSMLADQAYDDVLDHGDVPVTRTGEDWFLFRSLPRITWRCGAVWRRQFARAFDDLAGDLETGEWPIPRTTAEELALHLAIRLAPAQKEMLDEQDEHAELPERADDYDWHMCSQLFFQDHDVLMLYDNGLDGIESDSDANRELGLGHTLHPTNWFTPFNSGRPVRDETRGFRR